MDGYCLMGFINYFSLALPNGPDKGPNVTVVLVADKLMVLSLPVLPAGYLLLALYFYNTLLLKCRDIDSFENIKQQNL